MFGDTSKRDETLMEFFGISIAQYEAAGDDIMRLPEPVQTFLAVYSAQGIMDNGGLQFFFER